MQLTQLYSLSYNTNYRFTKGNCFYRHSDVILRRLSFSGGVVPERQHLWLTMVVMEARLAKPAQVVSLRSCRSGTIPAVFANGAFPLVRSVLLRLFVELAFLRLPSPRV